MKELLPILKTDVYRGGSILIAGPCSAETREQTLETAEALAKGGIKVFRAGIWKPRTRPGTFEGVGAQGLPWLREVKERTGMLTAVEVATAAHVTEAVRGGVDILWIGARTTANPFAVQEIADTMQSLGATDTPMLVKNPLNPDVDLWQGALLRLYNAGIRRLGAVHRGFSTYGSHHYRNMPMWHVPFELRRRVEGLPMICDPSHIGGKRELIPDLAQRALDMGFEGLIIESHCNPDCALSDARQQLTPDDLIKMLASLNYRAPRRPDNELAQLRQQIDSLDNEMVELLSKRMAISRAIGDYKRENGVQIVQMGRFDDILATRARLAEEAGMSGDFMRAVVTAIHTESVRQQLSK